MAVQGTFSRNRHGKMACLYGFAALASSVLVVYSEEYGNNRGGQALISPWLNILLMPFRWLEVSLADEPPILEPTMMSLPLLYLFEEQAIMVTLVGAVLLSALSLRQAMRAARNNEFSFWYASGGTAAIHALILVNASLGTALSILAIWVVEKIRLPSISGRTGDI